MSVQNLNQIILCSTLEHRSFLREVEIVNGTAIVTHVETLPFRFHELLAKHPVAGDAIDELNRAPIVPGRYKGCPFCGNRTTYWCSCGTASCKTVGIDRHYCPGCKTERTSKPVRTTYASESGFVGERLQAANSDQDREASLKQAWQRSQAGLFNLVKRGAV